MKHVNLDSQCDTVKRFISNLAADSSASVLEIDGRPMVCVVPMGKETNGYNASDEWNETKNARRCILIDKEISGMLTPDEVMELEGLQQEMLRHRRRVAALPLEDARSLHQQLLLHAQKESRSGS